MIYPWLKAAHVVAVMVWMAGMLAAPLAARILEEAGVGRAARRKLRSAFRWTVNPSMLAAFALGTWMGFEAGWFSAGWMHAKLALVVLMTALHGVIAARLRRFAQAEPTPLPAWFVGLSWAGAALMALIVVLVVRKAVV